MNTSYYTLHYKLTFHTDWHCGSGLGAGADLDTRVVRDAEGLPFLPGRTVKGLLRDAVNQLRAYAGLPLADDALVETFGRCGGEEKDAQAAVSFFTDAQLDERERKQILALDLKDYLYRGISRTAIDAHGIAVAHSLRRMEVVAPCTLCGQIYNVPEEMCDELVEAMKYVKRLGMGRHRGLGRCTFAIERKEEVKW